MTLRFTTIASVLALTIALPAAAQTALSQSTLRGVEALDDRIDDITDAALEDLDRQEDSVRFGPLGVVQGLRGSAALSASAASGNTDTGDLSFAGRMNYGQGPWSHSFGFAGEFGESNGVRSEEQIFATYEGSRYFTPEIYVFGTGRFEYDGFATNERDAFIGFGPGYRVVNTDQMAWRLQAGIGPRYTQTQSGVSETEAAVLASSRFFYGLTDRVSLTNDTDVLSSDINTVLSNDFGVNIRMTDALSTRVSYRTDYTSDPLPGLKSTGNTIGLSLVVGF